MDMQYGHAIWTCNMDMLFQVLRFVRPVTFFTKAVIATETLSRQYMFCMHTLCYSYISYVWYFIIESVLSLANKPNYPFIL